MVRMISSYTRDVLTPATVLEKLGKHHVVYIRITYLTLLLGCNYVNKNVHQKRKKEKMPG
jgi:hypothetical protein